MEQGLPALKLWEQAVVTASVVALAIVTWLLARRLGKWLQGSTRLGLRGLERLAAPFTLLVWVTAVWGAFQGAEEAEERFGWIVEVAIIVGGFWLAGRALDVVWETGRASARIRAQPAATGALLAGRLLGKAIFLLSAGALIAVRLGVGTQIYVALGAVGAALAFAAREPISNLFSFVQLTVDPPFRMGDRVRVGDFRGGSDVEGEVVGLTLAAVTIRARHRSEIFIPNSRFAELRIENLSASDRRRLELALPIPYRIPAEKLRSACERIDRDMQENRWVSAVRPPYVWISGYSGGLRLKVSVWLKRGTTRRRAQRDLLLAITSRFEEVAGVPPSTSEKP